MIAEPSLTPLRRIEDNAVALTFDDGPDPEFTPAFLDLLADSEHRATFFVLASQAVRFPELVRRIRDEGHTVGSHGWTHRHPRLQTCAGLREQVVRASGELATLTGKPVSWFRPAHGALPSCLLQAARDHGQRVALWSISAVDWGPWVSAQGIERRLSRIVGGDVVLMHDGRNRFNRPALGLKALPGLLASLDRMGLRSVGLAPRR